MKKIICVLLIISLFLICFAACSFFNIQKAKPVENTYTFEEDFSSVRVDVSECDVFFLPTQDEKCTVECHETDLFKHNAKVENGTLSVEREKSVGIAYNANGLVLQIKIYLPKTAYEKIEVNTSSANVNVDKSFVLNNLDVKTSSGDISVFAIVEQNANFRTSSGDITTDGFSAADLKINTSSGDVNLKKTSASACRVNTSSGNVRLNDVSCQSNFSFDTSSGDLIINKFKSQNLTVETSSGDISAAELNCVDLTIKTSSGDVELGLVSGKIFNVRSSSGKLEYPYSSGSGTCNVTTSSGDVKITIG